MNVKIFNEVHMQVGVYIRSCNLTFLNETWVAQQGERFQGSTMSIVSLLNLAQSSPSSNSSLLPVTTFLRKCQLAPNYMAPRSVRLRDEMVHLHRVIRETRVVEGRCPPDDDYACFISDYMERKPVIRESSGRFRHDNWIPSRFVISCMFEVPPRQRTAAKDLEFLEWVAVWFSTDSIEE